MTQEQINELEEQKARFRAETKWIFNALRNRLIVSFIVAAIIFHVLNWTDVRSVLPIPDLTFWQTWGILVAWRSLQFRL